MSSTFCASVSRSSNSAQDIDADARELVEVIWDKDSEDDVSSDGENVDIEPTTKLKAAETQKIDDENEPNIINVWKTRNENTDNAEQNNEIDTFIEQHANCPKKCTDNFQKSDIIRFIDESRELDETVDGVNRLNVVLLGIIRVLQSQTFAQPKRQRNNDGRKRVAVSYQIHGIPVCREFFLKVHAIGSVRWLNLIKTYKTKGLIEKKHGNCKKKPHHALPLADTNYAVSFLRNFAEQNALILPRQNANCDEKNTLKVLPPGLTKSMVFGKYAAACATDQRKSVSLCSFRRIWISCCPDIVLEKPSRSDLCDIRPKNYVTQKDHDTSKKSNDAEVAIFSSSSRQ